MTISKTQTARVESIDFLRGVVMILMALDHVRMYFALGTWYAEPTDLATTTPALFFTRWITHFCAPVFVFLAGTSAFLYGAQKAKGELAAFLFTRGLWLIFAELVLVNFAWTFDITYSFRILQVIWAIGVSMVVLAGLVFLPKWLIVVTGAALVFGHNLLDPIRVQGDSALDVIWHLLHQPGAILRDASGFVSVSYPLLPWIGLMALGYVFGELYRTEFPAERRRLWLLGTGLSATLLFLVLRGFQLYGEPSGWGGQESPLFQLMSFLNTTKYPPSLQFLLMTMGPALLFLGLIDTAGQRLPRPVTVFGRVPFFFYILHLYLIHALAMLFLVSQGRDWQEYIFSAEGLMSGRLSNFGLSLPWVYAIWLGVLALLYPLCKWYQEYRASHPAAWWLRYL